MLFRYLNTIIGNTEIKWFYSLLDHMIMELNQRKQSQKILIKRVLLLLKQEEKIQILQISKLNVRNKQFIHNKCHYISLSHI